MLIALGLTLATLRAEVIVIDPGGGPGDALLKQALAAAAPGDVLLLEPGDYVQDSLSYVIDKGITLLPATPGARIALGPIQLQYLPEGQVAVLRGFDVHAFGPSGSALLIASLRGTAWIEDCHFTAGDSEPGYEGGIAVSVYQAHAIFRHCSFAGGAGADTLPGGPLGTEAMSGGPALHIAALSNVALHDCTLVGGDSGSGSSGSAQFPPNGHALAAAYCNVTVSGCTLTGGSEGADNDATPGTSGSALSLKERASVQVLQSVLLPGAVQGAGTQGPAVDEVASTVQMVAEPARALVLPALAQVGQVVTLFLDGEPGDVALLMFSTAAVAWPVPRLEGTLALQPGTFGTPVVVGLLPGPDGQLSMPFSMGLAPGVEALTVFAQGLFQDADGASLGGASAITWIDAGP